MADLYKQYPSVIKVSPSDIIGTKSVNREKFPLDYGLIMFYSPHCPHCVNAVDDWVKVARELKGLVNVGSFNCIETDEHNKKSTELGIEAIPTVKIVKGGQLHPYSKGVSKDNILNHLCSLDKKLCKNKTQMSAGMQMIGMTGGGSCRLRGGSSENPLLLFKKTLNEWNEVRKSFEFKRKSVDWTTINEWVNKFENLAKKFPNSIFMQDAIKATINEIKALKELGGGGNDCKMYKNRGDCLSHQHKPDCCRWTKAKGETEYSCNILSRLANCKDSDEPKDSREPTKKKQKTIEQPKPVVVEKPKAPSLDEQMKKFDLFLKKKNVKKTTTTKVENPTVTIKKTVETTKKVNEPAPVTVIKKTIEKVVKKDEEPQIQKEEYNLTVNQFKNCKNKKALLELLKVTIESQMKNIEVTDLKIQKENLIFMFKVNKDNITSEDFVATGWSYGKKVAYYLKNENAQLLELSNILSALGINVKNGKVENRKTDYYKEERSGYGWQSRSYYVKPETPDFVDFTINFEVESIDSKEIYNLCSLTSKELRAHEVLENALIFEDFEVFNKNDNILVYNIDFTGYFSDNSLKHLYTYWGEGDDSGYEGASYEDDYKYESPEFQDAIDNLAKQDIETAKQKIKEAFKPFHNITNEEMDRFFDFESGSGGDLMATTIIFKPDGIDFINKLVSEIADGKHKIPDILKGYAKGKLVKGTNWDDWYINDSVYGKVYVLDYGMRKDQYNDLLERKINTEVVVKITGKIKKETQNYGYYGPRYTKNEYWKGKVLSQGDYMMFNQFMRQMDVPKDVRKKYAKRFYDYDVKRGGSNLYN